MTDSWELEVVRGPAATFHGRALPEPMRPALWWFEVSRPTLVLGTSQPDDVVDAEACAAAGVEVVRRHSGGSAVLLVPGEVAWFDVVVPRDHPRWDADVGRSAWWLGQAVRRAIARPDATVHTGPMVHSRWSALVCFAGLGAGEVHVGGAKLVGISQRRTRAGARFQCAVYRRWDPAVLVGLLRPPRPSVEELAGVVATAELTVEALSAALNSDGDSDLAVRPAPTAGP